MKPKCEYVPISPIIGTYSHPVSPRKSGLRIFGTYSQFRRSCQHRANRHIGFVQVGKDNYRRHAIKVFRSGAEEDGLDTRLCDLVSAIWSPQLHSVLTVFESEFLEFTIAHRRHD